MSVSLVPMLNTLLIVIFEPSVFTVLVPAGSIFKLYNVPLPMVSVLFGPFINNVDVPGVIVPAEASKFPKTYKLVFANVVVPVIVRSNNDPNPDTRPVVSVPVPLMMSLPELLLSVVTLVKSKFVPTVHVPEPILNVTAPDAAVTTKLFVRVNALLLDDASSKSVLPAPPLVETLSADAVNVPALNVAVRAAPVP